MAIPIERGCKYEAACFLSLLVVDSTVSTRKSVPKNSMKKAEGVPMLTATPTAPGHHPSIALRIAGEARLCYLFRTCFESENIPTPQVKSLLVKCSDLKKIDRT